MRDYRGKTNTGEWVYGSLINLRHGIYFIAIDYDIHTLYTEIEMLEVIPETVGQSTGIEDKNSKMIYGSIEINGKMSKGGDRIINPDNPDDKSDVILYEDGQFRLGEGDPFGLSQCRVAHMEIVTDSPDLLEQT